MNSKVTGEGDEDADVLKKWPKMIKNQEFIELIHRKNTASSRKEPTLRLSQVVKDAIRKQLL